ncbi:hypothetical protein Lser_V15G06452 [Lactuca serriola]
MVAGGRIPRTILSNLLSRVTTGSLSSSTSSSSSSSSSFGPPSILISRRGIASKLYVAGLSFYTTEKALSDVFSQFGQVVEATVMMDKVSSRSKGFGFVTFASELEAEKAINEMDQKPLHGRVIHVELAKPRRPYSSAPIARGPPEPPTDVQ